MQIHVDPFMFFILQEGGVFFSVGKLLFFIFLFFFYSACE